MAETSNDLEKLRAHYIEGVTPPQTSGKKRLLICFVFQAFYLWELLPLPQAVKGIAEKVELRIRYF